MTQGYNKNAAELLQRFYGNQEYVFEDFNFTKESFMPELMKRTQLKWFTTCVSMSRMDQYKVSVTRLVTKLGFCFSLNLEPLASLLWLEK